MSGQAIVETALMLPVMLAVLLGVIGILYLDISTRRMQQGVDVLADLAAQDPDWRASVPFENDRTGCNANPVQPDATYTHDGRAVLLTWHCHLETRWLFDGLPVTVEGEAVIAATPAASPAPS